MKMSKKSCWSSSASFDADKLKILKQLTAPHTESFSYMLDEGIETAVRAIRPAELELPNGRRLGLQIGSVQIGNPSTSPSFTGTTVRKSTGMDVKLLYPSECRQAGLSYRAKLLVTLNIFIDSVQVTALSNVIGEVPIMVGSSHCNLTGMTPEEMVEKGEEASETGGYFVVHGLEKILRLLIVMRRNYPLALVRPKFKARGPLFTEFGICMRCVQDNHTANVITLHYLMNGVFCLSFMMRGRQYFVPLVVILKALCNVNDKEIFDAMIRGYEENAVFKGYVLNMLSLCAEDELHTQKSALKYLGRTFRVVMNCPSWYSDVEVGELLLTLGVCIHLHEGREKFNCLVQMGQKLFALVQGQCREESPDNPMFQEVSLPGHLFLMFLKERLESWLERIKSQANLNIRRKSEGGQTEFQSSWISSLVTSNVRQFTRGLEYLIATGNLINSGGLAMQQTNGLAIIAEKINYLRYLSHFRAVHRGANFQKMRTTNVRKFLPEAWGFICPVHTPDGSPCGLLNHMTADCVLVSKAESRSAQRQVQKILEEFDLVSGEESQALPPNFCRVWMDGKILGFLTEFQAKRAENFLRFEKLKKISSTFEKMEISLVEPERFKSIFPGLYIFSTVGRMMRPVRNLIHGRTEFIGTFEQVFLGICITAEEFNPKEFTHQEISVSALLSSNAQLVPFSDHNQSPRNVYQCQMGKQTMGTPCHNLMKRSDNKMYKLQTPQTPMVRCKYYDEIAVDRYPLGTNAVIAVISYTGYDMEDAMVINKSSFQRGFGHGSVYKTELIDLFELGKEQNSKLKFGRERDPIQNGAAKNFIDQDGLPFIGVKLNHGDPYYSYLNETTGRFVIKEYHHAETAYVENVKILGFTKDSTILESSDIVRVCIMIRIQRNPIVGDKFASRHGQKGICSKFYPAEDMPFTESGTTPDIIFNPHGFPSRMTIGMMIECMAGKSAALHGLKWVDASPFQFDEENPAYDFFGKQLEAAGFNYFGNERMYSGIDGREFEVDVFFGVVYYQRLRHMVADKFQVRSTGPVDSLTHQPIKGRSRGGGIRFGEMERDAILAHGCSFLLQDRLLNCSDKDFVYVCVQCGNILSICNAKVDPQQLQEGEAFVSGRQIRCLVCNRTDVRLITLPYIFRFLANELASVNIKLQLKISDD